MSIYNILRKILCKLGIHTYDKENVFQKDNGELYSKCKYCNCMFIYGGNGNWYREE